MGDVNNTNSAAVTAGPPLAADPQDPLPESNWKYRRWLVFGSEIARTIGFGIIITMLFFIAKAALKAMQADTANAAQILLQAIEALHNLAWWLVILALVDRVLYLIAPSAEQATKMIATASALKGGVTFASRSAIATPQGRAEASSSAGPAAVAPTQPVAVPEPAAEPVIAAPAPGLPAQLAEELPEYAR
jgi:hypothetical protein